MQLSTDLLLLKGSTFTFSGSTLHVKPYVKQKHPGYKKVRGQSEAALQIGMCDQKL